MKPTPQKTPSAGAALPQTSMTRAEWVRQVFANTVDSRYGAVFQFINEMTQVRDAQLDADFGAFEVPATFFALEARAYTGVTISGTNLFAGAVRATGDTTAITGGLRFTSMLPGERSRRHEDGYSYVGKPIRVVIENNEEDIAVDVEDADTEIIITITHGDNGAGTGGVATLEEVIAAIEEHATAKYIITCSLLEEGTETDDVDADDEVLVASAIDRRGLEPVISAEDLDSGALMEIEINGTPLDGLTEGYGVTAASATALTLDFDLSAATAPVRLCVRLGGVLVFDAYFPIGALPFKITNSVAAEAANARDITFTIKDTLGVTSEKVHRLLIEAMHPDGTVSDPTADYKLAAASTPVGTIVWGTNKNRMYISTSADGIAAVKLTDVTPGAHTPYVMATLVNEEGRAASQPSLFSVAFAA